jgi:hypothetical protein
LQVSGVSLSDSGELLLAAGGAADAPLKFQSGTKSHHGGAGRHRIRWYLFLRHVGCGNRGVIPLEHFIILNADYTLANSAPSRRPSTRRRAARWRWRPGCMPSSSCFISWA